MPQPFRRKNGQEMWNAPDVITQRPLCAIGVGRVCAAWAVVEDGLLNLLASAMTDWHYLVDPTSRSRAGRPNIPLQKAFERLETISLKMIMLEASFSAILPENYRQRLHEIGQTLRKRVQERNKVAHARWWIAQDFPSDVFIMVDDSAMKFTQYKPRDFDNSVKRILDDAKTISRFADTCADFVADRNFSRYKAGESPSLTC